VQRFSTVVALSFSLVTAGLQLANAETGLLTGSVVDQKTQEPLPVANVQVLGTALGASTDIDGKFRIASIPFGTIQVRVSLVGFEPVVLGDVVIRSGRPTELVVQLNQVPVGLEGVEVTASYFQKTPDLPTSVQRLSYEEIRRSPGGFEDVVRAISVLPGVAQAAPGRNDLVVRGGAPSENLFFLDDIEIPNINHFGTQGSTGGPLSFINLDFVREASFSTGGFGVRYGDRLSSVLDIDLRSARSDRIGGKATISATQFGLNLEGPTGEQGSFIFSARRSYLDLVFKAAGFSFVPEYWDFLGKFDHALSPADRISVLGIAALDDVNYFNDTADDRYDNSRILGTAQNQYAAGVAWEHLFRNGLTTVSVSRNEVSYDGSQRDSLLNPIFLNRSREAETGLRADLLLKSADGGLEFELGTQIKRVDGKYTLFLPEFVSSFGDTLSVNINDEKGSGTKGSAYAQVSSMVLPRLQLTVGGRVDYFSAISTKFYGTPRASLVFTLSAKTNLTGSVGLYRQFPSYVWLVGSPDNINLKAMRVAQYVLGVEHFPRPDLKIRLEGFAKTYADYAASLDRTYLVMANTGAGYGGAEQNFDSFGFDRLASGGAGRALGIELLLQKKLSAIPAYGIASLTLSETRFTGFDGIERPGTFDQRVLLNLSGGYQFDERWEASLRFRLATGAPYTPYNNDGSQNPSMYNSERFDVAHSLDLRVDRRWNFSGWSLIGYVDIQNVYNNPVVSSVRWDPRTGEQVFNESIGILPSIGVSAEF